ncbi:MAG: hypothetical protein MUF34_36925 [Polyangiaceae bacterium]|nr:hypothetical protein [Polyangiaceae bacterium]
MAQAVREPVRLALLGPDGPSGTYRRRSCRALATPLLLTHLRSDTLCDGLPFDHQQC